MSENKDRKPELPAIGFVEGIGDEDRQALADCGEFLLIKPDEVLIKQGDAQDSLHLVVSGLLHVYILAEDNRRILLKRLHSGESIGEVNIFDPDVASATVAGVEYAQVWRVDLKSLEDYLQERPVSGAHVLIGIAKQLSQRLREANEKISLAQQALPKYLGVG